MEGSKRKEQYSKLVLCDSVGSPGLCDEYFANNFPTETRSPTETQRKNCAVAKPTGLDGQ